MFSTVTSCRLRFQLSSSVSIDTMRRTLPLRIQPSPECCRTIQRAEPPPTPTRAEDRELLGHAPGLGPVTLVGVVPTQEIEAAVAALDRAPDHRTHQHQADALALPAWIAATLVEVHRVATGETVPRRGRLAIEVERGQPQLLPRGQLGGEAAVESLHGGVPKRTRFPSTRPATFVQRHQTTQALVDVGPPPPSVMIRDRHRVVTSQVSLLAAQRLAARGRESAEIPLPIVEQLEVWAA